MNDDFVCFRIPESYNRAAAKLAIQKGRRDHEPAAVIKTHKVGIVGEQIVHLWLQQLDAEYRDTVGYDIEVRGLRLEVKTRSRSVVPRPNFEAAISAKKPFQSADYYVCASLVVSGYSVVDNVPFDTYSYGYICGIIQPDKFKKLARFYGRDEQPWCRYDCYSLSYDNMIKPRDFKEQIRLLPIPDSQTVEYRLPDFSYA